MSIVDQFATPTEGTLADIWCKVLGLDEVAPTDNFFALGGHSLKAMQVVVRGRRAFGAKFGLADLFKAQDLRSLARAIDEPSSSSS